MKAVAKFAAAYADQSESDHRALRKAVRATAAWRQSRCSGNALPQSLGVIIPRDGVSESA